MEEIIPDDVSLLNIVDDEAFDNDEGILNEVIEDACCCLLVWSSGGSRNVTCWLSVMYRCRG